MFLHFIKTFLQPSKLFTVVRFDLALLVKEETFKLTTHLRLLLPYIVFQMLMQEMGDNLMRITSYSLAVPTFLSVLLVLYLSNKPLKNGVQGWVSFNKYDLNDFSANIHINIVYIIWLLLWIYLGGYVCLAGMSTIFQTEVLKSELIYRPVFCAITVANCSFTLFFLKDILRIKFNPMCFIIVNLFTCTVTFFLIYSLLLTWFYQVHWFFQITSFIVTISFGYSYREFYDVPSRAFIIIYYMSMILFFFLWWGLLFSVVCDNQLNVSWPTLCLILLFTLSIISHLINIIASWADELIQILKIKQSKNICSYILLKHSYLN